MRYFDTSFLVPLILAETTSSDIEVFVAGLPEGEMTTSHLTRVEFSSVLARDIRMRAFDPAAAKTSEAKFEMLMVKAFDVLVPTIQDFNTAKDFVANYETRLRAYDALHLAIARNNGCDAIYTLDKTLLRAGRMLGLPVSTGISLPGYDG